MLVFECNRRKKKGVSCHKNHSGYFLILLGYFYSLLSAAIWSGVLREEVCDNSHDTVNLDLNSDSEINEFAEGLGRVGN